MVRRALCQLLCDAQSGRASDDYASYLSGKINTPLQASALWDDVSLKTEIKEMLDYGSRYNNIDKHFQHRGASLCLGVNIDEKACVHELAQSFRALTNQNTVC